jgi:hypothetical protein
LDSNDRLGALQSKRQAFVVAQEQRMLSGQRVAPMSSMLPTLFSELPDSRRDQGKMYPLAPILLFTVLGMLAGARSYYSCTAVSGTGRISPCAPADDRHIKVEHRG